MDYPLLSSINAPADLRRMSEEDMPALADEIRRFLVSSIEKTGGHLASNLGVVELTLALHRTLDLEKDRIIFDVGHQCYVHKLLTGRANAFDTLRTVGGLSGFPKREESRYDAFGTGHSSTSLSAALGFAEAAYMSGSDAYTVAVIGDRAFTGGMIHEALNNCRRDRKLILILNENEMSISRNIGRFAEHIARIRASEGYYKTKNRTTRVISSIPFVGKALFRGIRFMKQALKNLMYGSNLFEELGLYYLGPVDGNNYERVRLLLREAISYGKSAVIHLHTTKGKGYPPAEQNPAHYHSIPPLGAHNRPAVPCFSEHLGKTLCALSDEHPDLCAITAAMGEATGLEPFREACPDRFFDVGIAEPHALTFCAGLAAAGMRPVFAVYSSFLQRGYDNLIHDIALQNLPVTICVDRAGLSGGDGVTHHGIFDVAFLAHIPNMTVIAPADFASMEDALRESLQAGSPYVIRYANGCEIIKEADGFHSPSATLAPRADYSENEDIKTVIVTYGRLVDEAKKAAARIKDPCGVILVERIVPFSRCAGEIAALLPQSVERILIVEEGIRTGGMAEGVRACLTEMDAVNRKTIRILAVEEPFSPTPSSDGLFAAYGIGADDMLRVLGE